MKPNISLKAREEAVTRSLHLVGVFLLVGIAISGCAQQSDRGKIVFQSNRDGNLEIYTMNLDGSDQRRVTRSPSNDFSPCWSPDGRWIAFASDRSRNWEIYAVRADGSNLRTLTHGEGSNTAPSWTPDGKQILFVSTRDAIYGEIYRMNADGSRVERITYVPAVKDSPVMLPDEKTLIVTVNTKEHFSIASCTVGDSLLHPLTPTEGNSRSPRLSPDGSQLLYTSDRTGVYDLYALSLNGGAPERLTSDADVETSGEWTPSAGTILVAKNYAIYLRTLATGRDSVLSARGDSAPHCFLR
jgi:Tol biopolymer transport system component